MDENGIERRLSAILAADIAGYTKLMEADQEATVARLRAVRGDIIDPKIAQHHGRIVKNTGDGFLAEFSTVLDAVLCAVDLQAAFAAMNEGEAAETRMDFRIGVNLGDIVAEDDDIHGDGVNIAARLESIADVGGICVSADVYNQVRKRLDIGFEDMGGQMVKNIAEPIATYRVLLDGTRPEARGRRPAHTAHTAHTAQRRPRGASRARVALVTALIVIAVGGGLLWWRPWQPYVETASVDRMAMPLPKKPSIAVLPFDNLSGDPSQTYIADGITEDIITQLSQISALFVVARNSTFTYKGRPVKVQEVAEDLGVRYVLEGSMQKSGNTLRITAQLIDALSGNHLWAQRFDGELGDMFQFQDDITNRIVAALRIKLTEGEETRVHRTLTDNMEAWNLLNKGMERFYLLTKTANAEARENFQNAIKADGGYALAYAALAWTHWLDGQNGWSGDRGSAFKKAEDLAAKALELDPALPDVHALRGAIYLANGDYDKAIASAEKAVELNPNDATNNALLAMILSNVGRPEDALARMKSAMRLSPYYPDWFLKELGNSYARAGRNAEALAAFKQFLERKPSLANAADAHLGRALALHEMGRMEEAKSEVSMAMEMDGEISASGFGRNSVSKDKTAVEKGMTALKELGLRQ